MSSDAVQERDSVKTGGKSFEESIREWLTGTFITEQALLSKFKPSALKPFKYLTITPRATKLCAAALHLGYQFCENIGKGDTRLAEETIQEYPRSILGQLMIFDQTAILARFACESAAQRIQAMDQDLLLIERWGDRYSGNVIEIVLEWSKTILRSVVYAVATKEGHFVESMQTQRFIAENCFRILNQRIYADNIATKLSWKFMYPLGQLMPMDFVGRPLEESMLARAYHGCGGIRWTDIEQLIFRLEQLGAKPPIDDPTPGLSLEQLCVQYDLEYGARSLQKYLRNEIIRGDQESRQVWICSESELKKYRTLQAVRDVSDDHETSSEDS